MDRLDGLASEVEAIFPESSRTRGRELFDAGATRPHSPGPNLQGGIGWFVNVHDGQRWWDCHGDTTAADPRWILGCTCAVRQPVIPCAHLWAAILAVTHRR